MEWNAMEKIAKKQVKWVFERDCYLEDDNVQRMISFCKARNVPYQHVDFVLFGSSDHIKWKFGDDEIVICYGSIGFARHVLRTKKWYPGVWCDFEKLRCTSYLAHWGEFSIHQHYALLPLNEVKRKKDYLFQQYGKDGHTIFIRPDSNDKIFHGEKVHYDLFDKWWSFAQIYQPTPEQLTMVSAPSVIKNEWRFVVSAGEVVTGSRYVHTPDGNVSHAKLGDVEEDEKAFFFAETVSRSTEWKPAPIYTLDVCQSDNDFRLLECGSINTSGLYKCSLERIMVAAEGIAMGEWSELIL